VFSQYIEGLYTHINEVLEPVTLSITIIYHIGHV